MNLKLQSQFLLRGMCQIWDEAVAEPTGSSLLNIKRVFMCTLELEEAGQRGRVSVTVRQPL